MLFNSIEFIFAFWPITLALFFVVRKHVHWQAALGFLAVASLLFYGWWQPIYVLLIVGSITFNFLTARAIVAQLDRKRPGAAKALMVFGVSANLSLLGWYKYSAFAATTINQMLSLDVPVVHIALPLAISFFTFQQIAFLVDVWHGTVRGYSPLKYGAFILFFPHLLAGPILYHGKILPQFQGFQQRGFRLEDLSIGITIFIVGLAKKTLIADQLALHVNPLFAAAAAGQPLDLCGAWLAALGYTAQLYFDFSGYSDMAVGIGRSFGIKLPINFASPYQAGNIIEFWRRWHMTLSAFLKTYLYIPLGGGRCGPLRRHANLMGTMLLGGLWHGAGWTFILWGGLHGLYLIVNHGWRAFRPGTPGVLERKLGWLATFLAVTVAWVLFRAPTMDVAVNVLTGMVGQHGLVLPVRLAEMLPFLGARAEAVSAQPLMAMIGLCATALGLAFIAPNIYQILARWEPADLPKDFVGSQRLTWQPGIVSGIVVGLLATAAALIMLDGKREFLYYNF